MLSSKTKLTDFDSMGEWVWNKEIPDNLTCVAMHEIHERCPPLSYVACQIQDMKPLHWFFLGTLVNR